MRVEPFRNSHLVSFKELNSEAGQAVDIDELYSIMLQAPGFMDKMYEHSNSTVEWPTLGELVSTNQVGLTIVWFQFRFFFSCFCLRSVSSFSTFEGHPVMRQIRARPDSIGTIAML